MTEGPAPAAAPPSGAGALLRAAREKQGLHIAALAAAIKVPQKKLEALERDDFAELPDAAFARALAQSMCRVLKLDPAPVLALMPRAGPASLESVSSGLNTPFRDQNERGIAAQWAAMTRRPLAWAGGVLLLAAVLVAALPARWWEGVAPLPAPSVDAGPPPAAAPTAAMPAQATATALEAAPAVVAAASQPAPARQIETVHSVPQDEVAPAAASGALVLRAREPSWVEVVDSGGTVLVSRTLQTGESLGLDGPPPLKVKIGNAAGTELSYKGRPVDLVPATRENVARLELP